MEDDYSCCSLMVTVMLDSDLSPCLDVDKITSVFSSFNLSIFFVSHSTNISDAIIKPGKRCYTFFAVTIHEIYIIVCRQHKSARLIYDAL